jgi:enoyl-CoA hydratase/carnithine racemase
MTMLLSGDPIDSATALDWGLVSQVVEGSELLAAAGKLAEVFEGQAPLAVAATKRAVAGGLDRPLHDGLAAEQREFAALFGSEDAREGITAFLEKRRPDWHGR